MSKDMGSPGTTPPAVSAVTSGQPDIMDALSEIYILREALKGAITGDRLIERQFAGSDDKLHQWAAKQAAHNALCNSLSLERSLEDFPWSNDWAAIAKATGQ